MIAISLDPQYQERIREAFEKEYGKPAENVFLVLSHEAISVLWDLKKTESETPDNVLGRIIFAGIEALSNDGPIEIQITTPN